MANQDRSPNIPGGVEFTGLIQTMLNAISKPVSVKPGGYCEDIFLDLTPEEKEQYECSICYLIAKDPRECPNQHLFCSSCIFTWSMSLTSECRSKCPVCRSDGRYRPNPDKDKALSKKHVKCPEKKCSWAGELLDYKWHMRRHGGNDEKRSLPPMMRTRSTPRLSTNNLADSFEVFADRLDSRRRNIQQHFVDQEFHRRESMDEVEDLSRRLGHVAQDIVHLLDNMQHDSRRFQHYLDETQNLLPALNNSPMTSPRGVTTPRATTRRPPLPTEPSHREATTPRAATRRPIVPTAASPLNSPRSSSRLDRIMSEPTSTNNPFTIVDNQPILRPPPRTSMISLAEGFSPREADARVEHIMSTPTPTTNPFTLPNNLPILRPPPITRNSVIFPDDELLPEQLRSNLNERAPPTRNASASRRASLRRSSLGGPTLRDPSRSSNL